MTINQDDLLAGRYRLVEPIASGGMGEVWRAHDETLDRDVAVKVLRQESANEPGFVERFRAEARHSGGLSHPNIGTVHDFGEDDGTPFLVMEMLAGEPLSTLIHERAPMPHQEVSDILYQAAIALQAAHEAGVVHRDVKPANIVVDSEGYAKLTDFGIARALNEASLTMTGEVLGTPHYLAPEQARGEPAGPLSDVYALAVVGYEMLTGQRPFSGESMVTTALAHVSQPAPQLSDEVAEPLRTTVMSALAKSPGHRPASAAEFAEALRMPAGEVPDHLREGAASAVAPVIVGVPEGLAPDAALPTSGLPTSVLLTPRPGETARMATGAARGDDETTGEHRRQHAWLLPVLATAVVLLLLVTAIGLAGRSGAVPPGGRSTDPSSTARTPGQPATPAATTAPTRTALATTVPRPAASKAPAQPAAGAGKGKGQEKGKGERQK